MTDILITAYTYYKEMTGNNYITLIIILTLITILLKKIEIKKKEKKNRISNA